mgnify:CR=1 FL=1
MSKPLRFPKEFVFGTATSSFQIEGDAHHRGRSIWDDFCNIPGAILDNSDGLIACDHVNRYKEDVALMKEMGVDSYRFSISWPRIIPDGSGEVSKEGIAFYRNLLKELNAQGISPMATLYHWDLPSILELKGGWRNRETAYHFRRYAEVCFTELGDLVEKWLTFNEPFCTAILGHLTGEHAPGMKDLAATHKVIHHINLAHGLTMEAFRTGGYNGEIGTTLNLSTPRPATDCPEDILAADRAADRDARVYLDPVIGKGYPKRYLDAYPEAPFPIEEGDMEIIGKHKLDYLGINYYTEYPVTFDKDHPENFKGIATDLPKTHMGWDITPEGLLRLLHWTHKRTEDIQIFITENGSAWDDRLDEQGKINDTDRVSYLESHLAICQRAIEEDIPLTGYYAWSTMDNFEWAWGYARRFGLIYCDFETQKRTPKESFYRYREIVKNSRD